MKNIKSCPLGVVLALVLFGLSATGALACEQHFPGGGIGNCPGQSCDDFIDPGDGTYCVECGIDFYNPQTYYITYNKRTAEAWIVGGKKPVMLMGEKYVAFNKDMLKKYGKVKRDKAVDEKIKAEFAAFRKADDHKVSPERLEKSAKILNLKVRNIE